MHFKGLFKKKHNTLRKKIVFGQEYLCSILCLHQKKKASISTLGRCILFWKVDLKNGGEEGSHKLFYLILIQKFKYKIYRCTITSLSPFAGYCTQCTNLKLCFFPGVPGLHAHLSLAT